MLGLLKNDFVDLLLVPIVYIISWRKKGSRELKAGKRDSPQSLTHHNYLCREIKRRGKADKEA